MDFSISLKPKKLYFTPDLFIKNFPCPTEVPAFHEHHRRHFLKPLETIHLPTTSPFQIMEPLWILRLKRSDRGGLYQKNVLVFPHLKYIFFISDIPTQVPPLTPGTNKTMAEALKASFASWEKEQLRLNITKGKQVYRLHESFSYNNKCP